MKQNSGKPTAVEGVRLQKILAEAGIASRRKAEEIMRPMVASASARGTASNELRGK